MAKVKKAVKARKRKSGSGGPKVHAFLILFMLMSVAFLPTAFVLGIGMAPLAAAFFVDRNKNKIRVLTVGAMNLAGCMPFLMRLWFSDHSLETAFTIVLDPLTIIIIYSAAGAGYVIDWVLTVVVAGVVYQRGQARKKSIEKRQAELAERWGEEVTGSIALDHEGFPIE